MGGLGGAGSPSLLCVSPGHLQAPTSHTHTHRLAHRHAHTCTHTLPPPPVAPSAPSRTFPPAWNKPCPVLLLPPVPLPRKPLPPWCLPSLPLQPQDPDSTPPSVALRATGLPFSECLRQAVSSLQHLIKWGLLFVFNVFTCVSLVSPNELIRSLKELMFTSCLCARPHAHCSC